MTRRSKPVFRRQFHALLGKGHTTEPAKGSAADTEQQTAAHGVSVAYLLGRSITISTWAAATEESVWQEIFHAPEGRTVFRGTQSCVRCMYG